MTVLFQAAKRRIPVRCALRGKTTSAAAAAHTASSNQRIEIQSKEFQFLQQSPVPTDFFQKSLPRLPVPKLEKTCERYLASQRALESPEAFAKTEAIVNSFLAKEGKELHEKLVRNDKVNKHTSYISEPWFDMYLKDRRPVSFTHNPGISLANDERPEFRSNTPLRAANLLIAALRFQKSLQRNILLPDVFHMVPAKTSNPTYWNKVKWMPRPIATYLSYLFNVYPLDMSQFPNLLQSTRIPMPGKDAIQRFPDSKHMLVLSNGMLFTFNLFDDKGEIMEPKVYLAAFKRIKELSRKKSGRSGDIGALTSLDRDTWTEARRHLFSLGNEATLKQIDSALFAMCLDDHWSFDETEPEVVVKELCCGSRPENRWFDKSFSLIFSNNGCVGVNFEHAWGDGVAIMRFLDEIVNDSRKNAYVSDNMEGGPEIADEVNLTELELKTDAKVEEYVNKAKREHMERHDSVDFKFIQRHGFGKADCKKAKVGPDAVMQLAFQIAHHLVHGKFAASYESCTTALFRHGRTETVRPLTADQKACAEGFVENRSDSELLSLLQQCSKTHMDMTKLAAQGHGWDRHLFALKNIASKESDSLPEIFQDPAYNFINKIIISTSTLSSENFGVGGFCPVTPNGYGLGYQIRGSELGAGVSVFKDISSSTEMADALTKAFDLIAKVVQNQQLK